MLALSVLACGPQPAPEIDARTRAAYADLVVAPELCRQPAPPTVDPVDMRSDLRTLERVLRRGYAGFSLAADEARWQQVLGDAERDLPAEPTTPLELRDFLIDRLSFLDDNHVGLWLYGEEGRDWRGTSAHQRAWIGAEAFARDAGGFVHSSGARVVTCQGREPGAILRPSLGEAPAVVHRPVLLSVEPVETITCTLRDADGAESEHTWPLRPMARADDAGPAFESYAPAHLRLRTLFASHAGALERFVDSAAAAREQRVVVLDVRGVAGGSDRYAVRWFRQLTSASLPYFERTDLQSEVTLQGALTFWGCVRAASRADAGGSEWLDARVERARRELDEAMRERGVFLDLNPVAAVTRGAAPRPFAGRLVLVVDRGCASACETFVLYARHLPGTIVVGENTEGTMKVGEIRSYRLPHSRIWVSTGTRVHHDPREGGFPEGRGYLPDLWMTPVEIDDGVSALVRCLGDAPCAAALDAALR